ncbi:3-dehydrosphinganine reductase [Collariella sp. IMI 366227]|nr:3-dehydrosphinganine reductase [Collariella sp. IMI 366227]
MGLFSRKNHMPVDGRTILITGASEGTGRSAAVQLAAKGANIILVARNVGRLEEALTELKAAASSPSTQRFTYISADVSQPGYATSVITEAIAWNNGRAPDIVWCVAGISTPLLWTDDASLPAARRNMDVNYFGSAEMSRAILREWLSPENRTSPDAEPKHIIFTASVLAFFAIVGYGPYTPSKWALRGLADTLAMEVGLYPDNPVKVHVVYPATIVTAGYERENETKPAITRELEKDEPGETPETVARRAIAGLEKGEHFVAVSFLGNLMRCGVMGGSQRNSWVWDTLVGVFHCWSETQQPEPRLAAAQLATHHAHSLDDELKGDPASVFDDVRMGGEEYAAAAAAAAAAMDTDLTEDAHGEAEAEADMDDDGTSGLPSHVDLSAASMLANGGAGAPGSAMSQPVQDQLQEMQQNLAHAQHAQHAHQHQQHTHHQHYSHQPTAQMGGPQQMQSHQAMDPSIVKTTEELAQDSGYKDLNVESALAKRLAREPVQRLAQQRRPEQSLNLAPQAPFQLSVQLIVLLETRNPQVVSQHPTIMPATNPGLAPEAAYRFTASHALMQSHGAGMGAVNHPSTMVTNNAVLQQMVTRAMNEVRNADKATRQLIQIDCTAKQLALQIAEYEEMVGGQDQTGGGVGQQVMGDESGA